MAFKYGSPVGKGIKQARQMHDIDPPSPKKKKPDHVEIEGQLDILSFLAEQE